MTIPTGKRTSGYRRRHRPVVQALFMPDDPGGIDEAWRRKPPNRRQDVRTLADMVKPAQRTTRESRCPVLRHCRVRGATCRYRGNLQRRSMGPADTKAAADPGLKALIEGVELTERSL